MAETNKKVVPMTEEQLKEKEADLNAQTEKLAQEKADFENAKAEFDTKKTEWENSAPIKPAEESIEDFEFECESYEFVQNAPQIINFGGQKFSRKELIENEAVLIQLIGGKSSLIRKK